MNEKQLLQHIYTYISSVGSFCCAMPLTICKGILTYVSLTGLFWTSFLPALEVVNSKTSLLESLLPSECLECVLLLYLFSKDSEVCWDDVCVVELFVFFLPIFAFLLRFFSMFFTPHSLKKPPLNLELMMLYRIGLIAEFMWNIILEKYNRL